MKLRQSYFIVFFIEHELNGAHLLYICFMNIKTYVLFEFLHNLSLFVSLQRINVLATEMFKVI